MQTNKVTMSDTRSYSSLTQSVQDTSSYVGFANLPNQVHRKSVKKGMKRFKNQNNLFYLWFLPSGFEFTLMVAGESGLGKSTLIDSLFLTDLYPDRVMPTAQDR